MVTKPTNAHKCIKVKEILLYLYVHLFFFFCTFIHLRAFVGSVTISYHTSPILNNNRSHLSQLKCLHNFKIFSVRIV